MFARIDSSTWRIATEVEAERRFRLLSGPCFEDIVEGLSKGVARISLRRERCKDDRGYFRVNAIVQYSSTETVDNFHNSSSGYRAQYLESSEMGERANTLATSALCSLVLTRLRERLPPRWCREWAETSLKHSSAKAWIHQGLWLWHAKEACEELIVDAWSLGRASKDPEVRRRARYGRQLPGRENRIDLKGVWVTQELVVRASFKPDRALSIHNHGFT